MGVAIDARISGSNSFYKGHLRLLEADQSVVERDVSGPNCVDVSAALALITAVTLDAFRANAPTGLGATAIQKKTEKRFAVGLTAGIDQVIAPRVVPTLGISLTYHDRVHFGSPEFRVAGLFAWSPWQGVYDGGGRVGDARFLWFASRSAACPLQAQWSSTTLGPCAVLELGTLTGEGRTQGGAQSKTGVWLAPGAVLNWSVQFEPVWLRLSAGAVAPVIRHTFQFIPRPEVFRSPSLGPVAEFELAWAF